MAPDIQPSTPGIDLARQSSLDALKQREALKAATVGEYIEGVRAAAQSVLDPLGRQELADYTAAIDVTTAGQKHIQLDADIYDTHVLGYAQIGGGEQSIRLNAAVVMDVDSDAGADEFADVVAHEKTHATKQAPMGDLIYKEDTMTAGRLYEAQAEMHGQEARGKSIHHHRKGQPKDYAEAQTAGLELLTVVSRNDFEDAMADGDSEGLQTQIWIAGLSDGSLTPDMVIEQASELGYEKGAIEALKEHYELAA
jgi:hypothetical protein